MQTIVSFLFVFHFFSLISCEIVEIEDGKVEGTQLQSRLGENFLAFFQIPYAEPPLGDLRFRAPLPVKPWSGTINGTKPGPICFQLYHREGASEDCLQLNVFTKDLQGSLPVVVFIHGGGFEQGSALDQGNPYSSSFHQLN
jgi:carboxylesterase type B